MSPGIFRFILASLVVVEHAGFQLKVGAMAVYLFFVLSGFWITRVLNTKYLDAKNGSLLFIVARIWRLYPAFIIATLAFALVKGDSLDAIVGNLSLFSGDGHQKYMLPAWSLIIEMHFYAIAPFIAIALRQKTARVYVIGAGVIWSAYAWTFHWLALPAFLPFFLLGALAATFDWKPGPPLLAASAAMAGAFFTFHAFTTDLVMGTGSPSDGFAVFAVQGVLAAILSPFAIRSVMSPGGNVDAFLGDMSYALYLAHWPVVNNAGGVLLWAAPDWAAAQWKEIQIPWRAVSFSILAALALYAAERPFEMLRSRVLRRLERDREPIDNALGAPSRLGPEASA